MIDRRFSDILLLMYGAVRQILGAAAVIGLSLSKRMRVTISVLVCHSPYLCVTMSAHACHYLRACVLLSLCTRVSQSRCVFVTLSLSLSLSLSISLSILLSLTFSVCAAAALWEPTCYSPGS